MKIVSALILFLLSTSLLAASWMFTNNNKADASFANGWPDLVATPDYACWESYAGYLARELTVKFTLHNSNPATVALGVQITGATSTSGVSLATATPVSVGDIAAGGSADVSLLFNVPAGVSNFYTNINGSADGTPYSLNPSPPATPVKLVFVHHSTGENWLTDSDGNLGTTLTASNYFVSDTNYGWGPADADAGSGTIGDHTDIGHWYNWFAGPHAGTYMTALYAQSGQNSSYP